jgi:hypothetical protein
MAKAYSPEDLATRAFFLMLALVLAWVASVFLFIL